MRRDAAARRRMLGAMLALVPAALAAPLPESAFETNFSTLADALANVEPWPPCALASLPPAPLVSVLGGSASAHSCLAYRADQGGTGGRYSDQLQFELDRLHTPFQIQNLAHGATDSVWSSLVLDEVLNASATDVLVWEYAQNDALGGSSGHRPRPDPILASVLDLWLWRVIRHFGAVGRAAPPIILLYLWDPGWASTGARQVVQQRAHDAQRRVVARYQRAGMRIATVNVGGVINGTETGMARRALDDMHHPSCEGMRLIVAMLRHVLMQGVGSARRHACERPPTSVRAQPRAHSGAVYSALVSDAEVASLMEWKPQAGRSDFRLGEHTTDLARTGGTVALPTRADRKLSYRLPACPAKAKITLIEPQAPSREIRARDGPSLLSDLHPPARSSNGSASATAVACTASTRTRDVSPCTSMGSA